MELAFAAQPWPFAIQRRAEIDARFAELQRQQPALWNGRVLILQRYDIADSVFRGSWTSADFASFLVWKEMGFPEAGVRDCFAQAVLRSADGAYLLGVMASHTANAGQIYFPSGTPDPSDVVGTAVDFDRNVWREVTEETGLTVSDLAADPGWITVLDGPSIAHHKIMRSREDAKTLRARILAFLARDREPELCDIRIVCGPADLDPAMPAFVIAFLNHMWAMPEQNDRGAGRLPVAFRNC
jgi:8-oxo-dGTP pyrophosphatase MutT (NUDIX family)